MKLTTYFLLIIFSISCSQKNKDQKIIKTNITISEKKVNKDNFSKIWTIKELENEHPYDFSDTILSNNYYLSFKYFRKNKDSEIEKCLILKNGNKIIDTLNVMGALALDKNLGYIGADFDKSFVFVNSFGSGNPHYISLLNKSNAENLIPEGSAWIDADTIKQVLLYSKVDVPSKKDSMTLFDTKIMKQKQYPFPDEIFGGPELLNRIKLLQVTNSKFTIQYEFNDWKNKKTKTYFR